MAYDFDYLPSNFPLPGSDEFLSGKEIFNSGTLATGALALSKTSRICRLPRGFVPTGMTFYMGDGDSNASPTLVVEIGDGTTADQFMKTNTVGQAGGDVTSLAGAAFGVELTEDTDVVLTASTAAATAQAATFKVSFRGYIA